MVVREGDADGKRMRAVTMREKKREVKRVEMQKEKDKERQRYWRKEKTKNVIRTASRKKDVASHVTD